MDTRVLIPKKQPKLASCSTRPLKYSMQEASKVSNGSTLLFTATRRTSSFAAIFAAVFTAVFTDVFLVIVLVILIFAVDVLQTVVVFKVRQRLDFGLKSSIAEILDKIL